MLASVLTSTPVRAFPNAGLAETNSFIFRSASQMDRILQNAFHKTQILLYQYRVIRCWFEAKLYRVFWDSE